MAQYRLRQVTPRWRLCCRHGLLRAGLLRRRRAQHHASGARWPRANTSTLTRRPARYWCRPRRTFPRGSAPATRSWRAPGRRSAQPRRACRASRTGRWVRAQSRPWSPLIHQYSRRGFVVFSTSDYRFADCRNSRSPGALEASSARSPPPASSASGTPTATPESTSSEAEVAVTRPPTAQSERGPVGALPLPGLDGGQGDRRRAADRASERLPPRRATVRVGDAPGPTRRSPGGDR